MHKATVALAAFVVFLGCNADSPTSPGAAKHTESEAEQCPWPVLGIAGTWAGRTYGYSRLTDELGSRIGTIHTADTLRIELAPDPNPTGEPGVTYFRYTLRKHFDPSPDDDPEGAIADLDLPSLLHETSGIMGVYSAGGNKWEFNHITTYLRLWDLWDEEAKEYVEVELKDFFPYWGHEIRMFDDWLFVEWWDWQEEHPLYRRVPG